MFGDTKTAWKLSEEDLPPTLRVNTMSEKRTVGKTQTFQSTWFLFPIMLVLAAIWMISQAYLLDLGYFVSFNSETLPNFSTYKPVIVPTPVRYHLLQAPLSQEPAPPSLLHLSKLDAPLPNPLTPASYTPPNIPTELIKPAVSIPSIPVLPAPPTFKLVGIAQGRDGMVATLKIQDDNSGIKDQLQDVREGSSILNGYIISHITPDYVLIKKTGKIIRVE